jgi:hypothetical protein
VLFRSDIERGFCEDTLENVDGGQVGNLPHLINHRSLRSRLGREFRQCG